VRLFGYGPDEFEEREVADIETLRADVNRWPVLWVNVDGLADLDLLENLGEAFGLHRLALEDVINLHQRSKIEDYEDHVFIVTRMLTSADSPATEQVSMFLGKGFLLTFQERSGDCFDLVRNRIRQHRGRIRSSGADYLTYALLDSVIDGYFPALEVCGERLESLENRMMEAPDTMRFAQIHDMKRDLLAFRRVIWPLREMVNALTRDERGYIFATATTTRYSSWIWSRPTARSPPASSMSICPAPVPA
jgi:magnesium transporter